MKETRDVGFLFMCMAIGMACGTGFYTIAVVFTLFRLRDGLLPAPLSDRRPPHHTEMVLTVHLPDGTDPDTALQPCFYEFLEDHSLLSMESIRGGNAARADLRGQAEGRGGAHQAAGETPRDQTTTTRVVLLTGTTNAEL